MIHNGEIIGVRYEGFYYYFYVSYGEYLSYTTTQRDLVNVYYDYKERLDKLN